METKSIKEIIDKSRTFSHFMPKINTLKPLTQSKF